MRVNSSRREEMQDYICQSILDNHCVVSYDSFLLIIKKLQMEIVAWLVPQN